LIETAAGPAFFTANGSCAGFSVGTKVVFANPGSSCSTNQLSLSGFPATCSVSCNGAVFYSGVVAAVDLSTFVFDTTFGSRAFHAQTSCSDVLVGDDVYFQDSTAACETNTFANIRSGQFCDVWCP
jgi:hypothetical protein